MFIAIYCFANCLSNRFVRSYSISLSYSVRCAEYFMGMRLDTFPRLLHYYLGRVVRYGQVNGHYKEARSSINRMAVGVPWLSAQRSSPAVGEPCSGVFGGRDRNKVARKRKHIGPIGKAAVANLFSPDRMLGQTILSQLVRMFRWRCTVEDEPKLRGRCARAKKDDVELWIASE